MADTIESVKGQDVSAFFFDVGFEAMVAVTVVGADTRSKAKQVEEGLRDMKANMAADMRRKVAEIGQRIMKFVDAAGT